MGKCEFSTLWLSDDRFKSWLSPVLGKNDRARCTVCGVDFDVSNAGVAAVKSHMDGKKHKLKVSDKAASPMARSVVPQPGSATSSAADSSDVSARQPPAVNESAPSDCSNLLCALGLRVTNAKLLLLTGFGKSCKWSGKGLEKVWNFTLRKHCEPCGDVASGAGHDIGARNAIEIYFLKSTKLWRCCEWRSSRYWREKCD